MEKALSILSRDPLLLVLFGGGVFTILALIWYNTGRFFIVGWIIRLLWLVVNLVCITLWIVVLFLNGFFDSLRSSFIISRIIYLGGVGLNVYLYYQDPEILIYTVIPTLTLMYLVKFGINEGRVKGWIFYAPKPKQKFERPQKAPKAKADKPPAELTKPMVRLMVKPQRHCETLEEIKALLAPEQKSLVDGVNRRPLEIPFMPEEPPSQTDDPLSAEVTG